MFLPSVVVFGNTWSKTARAMFWKAIHAHEPSWSHCSKCTARLLKSQRQTPKPWTPVLGGKRTVLEWWVCNFFVTDPRLYLIIAYWAMASEVCLASLPPMMVMRCSVQEPTAFSYGTILRLITRLPPHSEVVDPGFPDSLKWSINYF